MKEKVEQEPIVNELSEKPSDLGEQQTDQTSSDSEKNQALIVVEKKPAEAKLRSHALCELRTTDGHN
jgi:hypothetical protein